MKTTIEFGGFYESIHSSHIDMMTENYFDDTKRYIDDSALDNDKKQQLFSGNARKVFSRLDNRLLEVGLL